MIVTKRLLSLASLVGLSMTGASGTYGESSSFSMSIVCDNDYAIYAGTSSGLISLLHQNDVTWSAQIASIRDLTFTLPDGCTMIYVLAMDGTGQSNLNGTINGVNITSVSAQMSTNVRSYLTGYTDSAVANGSFSVPLNVASNAFSQLTGTSWSTPTIENNQTVTQQSGFGTGYFYPESNARFFAFEATTLDIAVPEPSTTAFGLGLVGGCTALIRRRRK